MNKYSVAIIGCGSIGANKPDKYDSPDTKNILTHAHACYIHPAIDKIIFVDNDYKKAITAINKWKYKTGEIKPWNQLCRYNSIDTLFKDEQPDIIIVSTPTETHHEILSKISYHKPKLVIAEKPFCSNYKEAYEINSLYKANEIPLIVDYIRRFDPDMQALKYEILNGGLGHVQNCRVLYTRGLFHEGCHAIDMMNFLFGEFEEGARHLKAFILDRREDIRDVTETLSLIYKECNNIIFQGCDGRKFSIFEIDIIGTKKRVLLTDHGRKILELDKIPEPVYGDYDTLDSRGMFRNTCLSTKALYYLIDNAVAHIQDNKIPLLCTGDDALKVHEIYERLIR